MKALVYEGPKRQRILERERPQPGQGEVLVRIRACGICGSDVHGYLGLTGRRLAPMVMGHEFAGEIAQLGPGLTRGFSVGDRVTVQPLDFCGHCVNCENGDTNACENRRYFGVLDCDGAFQEYLCVPEKLLFCLPENLSFIEGSFIEPLAVSYCGVKKAGDLRGKTVLIAGGGTIGLLALCVVKTQGAKRIIVSDLSDFRLSIAKKLGADEVIKPESGRFREQLLAANGGELVDVSIEAVGIAPTVAQALEALKSRGKCVWIGNSARMIEVNMQTVVTRALSIYGTYTFTHREFGETLDFLAKSGLDLKALVSREVSLEEAVDVFDELAASVDRYLKVVVTF